MMKKITLLLLVITMTLISAPFTYANLNNYVKSEDSVFRWEKISEKSLDAQTTASRLKMISQKWQGITWQHTIDIIKPHSTKYPTLIYLLVTGTDKKDTAVMRAGAMAKKIGSPVVVLHDIPNQPLFNNLWEDDLMAFTFLKYLETQDDTWPLIFAMVKAVVRAMDAVEEFLKKEYGAEVKGFVVSGSSKRGWTSWLTAAIDLRVKGIVPIVYDNLNMKKQMMHQIASWKDYSKEISEYEGRSLPQRLLEGEKEVEELAAMVDPFAYYDRITVPKLIVIGTNDPYWPLDALNIYYNELVGEKYIHYVPNEGHQIGLLHDTINKTTLNTMAAFFLKVDGSLQFPKITWEIHNQKQKPILTIDTSLKPQQVRIWFTTSQTRDFRYARWTDFSLNAQSSTFRYENIKPKTGFIAFLGEAAYMVNGNEFTLSTSVTILSPQGVVTPK